MTISSESTINRLAQVGIKLNDDGSITRIKPVIPDSPENPNDLITPAPQHDDVVVVHKDIPVNQSKNTLMRIFLHRSVLDSSSQTNKLPIIVYFHGGGFIIGSATEPMFHQFCSILTVEIPCIVVSVGYRLAPEHRLPAAYEDVVEGMHLIKSVEEEWLTKYADFSNTYLMGSSAGGNIAYHAGLRAAVGDIRPLQIKGLLLHQPFFGGIERKNSELRLENDQVLPLFMADFMWDKSLPVGADRDHEYCNPTVGSEAVEVIRKAGWKVLVTGCGGDPLMDRQIVFANMLQDKGVKVEGKFDEGGFHGVEVFDPSRADALIMAIKNIMLS